MPHVLLPIRETTTDPAPRSPQPAMVAANAQRRVNSHRLLDGAREIVIDHHGNEYRLRLTRNDKLILTK